MIPLEIDRQAQSRESTSCQQQAHAASPTLLLSPPHSSQALPEAGTPEFHFSNRVTVTKSDNQKPLCIQGVRRKATLKKEHGTL